MRKVIALLLLVMVGGLALEVYVLLKVIHLVGDVLGPLLVLAALTFIGIKVVGFHARRMQQAFLSGSPGPRLIGLIGGILLVIPGFISSIIGALLQIPWLQRVFGKLGQAIGASLARRVLSRSGGLAGMAGMAGMPGMPGMPPGFGGFPGAGGMPGMGNPFAGMPGMSGLKPDDHVRKPTRTYETTLEREPDKLH